MTAPTLTGPGHAAAKTSRARISAGRPELGALRAQLEQQRTFRVRQLEELAATTHRDSAAATDEGMRQVSVALADAATVVLGEIDAALDRIERGRYGRCTRCGAGIPLERLQALPWASLCMPCHATQELSGAGRGPRPGRRERAALDLVEEGGRGSFPASQRPTRELVGDDRSSGEWCGVRSGVRNHRHEKRNVTC